MWNHLAATQQLFCFYLLWEQLWAARKPVVEFHCRCLVAPADGDVAQVRASGGLTLWARHKAATSPPDCCRFAGPDPTVSLHKTMVRTWCCCLFIFLSESADDEQIKCAGGHTNVFLPWNLVIFCTLTSAARLASSVSAHRSSSSSSSGQLPVRPAG